MASISAWMTLSYSERLQFSYVACHNIAADRRFSGCEFCSEVSVAYVHRSSLEMTKVPLVVDSRPKRVSTAVKLRYAIW